MSLVLNLKPIEKKAGKTYKDINCSDIENRPSIHDLQAIKNRIRNIFDWTKGSRILLPGFGNVLERIKYEPLNDLTLLNADKMIRAMFSYEPDVTLVNITLTPDYDRNELYIRIDYSVPKLNVVDNTELTIYVADT